MTKQNPTNPAEYEDKYKSTTLIGAPKLTIEIELDNDDPALMHSLVSELAAWGPVGGWDEYNATVTESDGTVRDAKLESYTGDDPIELDDSLQESSQ